MSVSWFSDKTNQRRANYIVRELQNGLSDDYIVWLVPSQEHGPPTYIISYMMDGGSRDILTLTFGELQTVRDGDGDIVVYAWRKIQEEGSFSPPTPDYIQTRLKMISSGDEEPEGSDSYSTEEDVQ